ncbi:MAG TPA: metallopeptidase TldD-related protein [Polyangia bacterium]|jgi:predicted Zn-dependent protease|nr:metallopeptidase TldD-related protein [Polyangia bacterium]
MRPPLDEERARAAVKAAFDAVDAAEVRVNIEALERGFLRWAGNGATTAGKVSDVSVNVSCAVGMKHADVSVNGLDSGTIAAAARRALELARLAPDDPELMPSLGAAKFADVAVAWSDAPVSADDRAGVAAGCIDAAKKASLVSAGFVDALRSTSVVATRAGCFGLFHASNVDMSTTARTQDGHGSGWGSTGSVAFANLDFAAAARAACDKALRSRDAKSLEPGVYPVVLEPAAVAGLLDYLSFDARSTDEGRSAFSRPGGGTRIGEKMMGAVTLRSDPAWALMPAAPFDDEGMPRAPATWVDAGVLRKLQTSRYWGKKTKRPADARQWTVAATGPRTQTLDELVAGLDRGLLVTRFFYIRFLEPQTVKVTGLTRDGVFLVEKGKVVGPVNNFRFNQSVLQMLADADGFTAPARVICDGQRLAAPGLRCRAFHMASRSDAI